MVENGVWNNAWMHLHSALVILGSPLSFWLHTHKLNTLQLIYSSLSAFQGRSATPVNITTYHRHWSAGKWYRPTLHNAPNDNQMASNERITRTSTVVEGKQTHISNVYIATASTQWLNEQFSNYLSIALYTLSHIHLFIIFISVCDDTCFASC